MRFNFILIQQESVRPRWPYDMRPSVRAEKYIVTLAVDEKTLPMATITGRTDRQTDRRTDGQTDRQTDRVRRNMRPPPREEGRIVTEQLKHRDSDSFCDRNELLLPSLASYYLHDIVFANVPA